MCTRLQDALQPLGHEVTGVAGGKIDQLAEDAVTQLLVEARRLEGEGIQVDILHAALAGFLLGALKERFSP